MNRQHKHVMPGQRSELWTRREFLGGLVTAGVATGLSGCCSLSPLSPPDLSPETLVIDPHCHVFNGWDLDIYNYEVPHLPSFLGLGPALLYSIATIVRAIAPTGEMELHALDKLVKLRRANVRSRTVEGRAWEEELFGREVRHQTARLAEEIRVKRDSVLEAGDPKAAVRALLSAKGREDLSAEWQAGKLQITQAVRKLKTPAGLAFFEPFFHYRVVNAQRLLDVYPMVALFTPAMMDTDSWFQRRPLRLSKSTPLTEQMEIYQHIAVVTNGRVLPFFAFDPRREGTPSPAQLVEECLRRNCFVGIKLYPPMGYRPVQNVERDTMASKRDWEPGLGAKLDARLAQVFRKCNDEEFCVMAHNNKSKASAPEHKDNGNPKYWKELLAQPEYANLKVNLSHFGGMDNKSGWREGICCLMKQWPGVYADIGDFTEITCEKARESFFKVLQAFLKKHEGSPLLDRLMYGSDYFMDGLAPGYEAYAGNWIVSFQSHFAGNWRELAGGNAANYLGLRSGKQRTRLECFFKENGLSPRWLDLVRQAPRTP